MIADQEARRAFGGRYRLLEFVGEGSNARVYVAEDLTLRRRVALKILRADTAEDARFTESFADEMRATSALSHPRVLPVYDWGVDPQ
ncbi:MAG: serine/threonine protein kinase, partial [Acidimicrobiaceae bacterium]|nr:serine/threonine protein kinase [Acidimicrobiaceae bacterium]